MGRQHTSVDSLATRFLVASWLPATAFTVVCYRFQMRSGLPALRPQTGRVGLGPPVQRSSGDGPGRDRRARRTATCVPQGSSSRIGMSGCGRLRAGVCGEYARKLLQVRRFGWSHACSRGTVNPSRKLRRFESFTCHHVLKGPLSCGNAGWGPFRCVRL